jgi:hypothetical protein
MGAAPGVDETDQGGEAAEAVDAIGRPPIRMKERIMILVEPRPPQMSRIGILVRYLVAIALFVLPQSASAIILMVVIGPLTLFEIDGLSFPLYSTTDRTTLLVRDTDTDRSAVVTVHGQREWRNELELLAFSRTDPDQSVRIEIDVSPLGDRAGGRFFELDAWGFSGGPEPVTDPALAALEGPLTFDFVLVDQTPPPGSHRRAVYRLLSVSRRELPGGVASALTGFQIIPLLSGQVPLPPASRPRDGRERNYRRWPFAVTCRL